MSATGTRQRIGIFGGSFDPIHLGHLLLAEQAREQLLLDIIRFIPAAQSPLKLDQRPQAADEHRLAMIRLAIAGNLHFVADDRELRRGGTSYTVDTLREMADEQPHAELVFLMGGDSLMDFHAWHQPQIICQLAFVAVLARGGHPEPDLTRLEPYLPTAERDRLAEHQIPMPQIEISSSDLRRRITAGRSTRYQLHPAVEAYIDAKGLYRPAGGLGAT